MLTNMAANIYVYRALYDFVAADHVEGLDQNPISEGDLIEVTQSSLSIGVDYKSPQAWLNGFNRTTRCTGHVPGNFLKFVKVLPPRHAFILAYFAKPAMCNLCKDYIWGSNTAGMKCEACSKCYHHSCSEMINDHCTGESRKLAVDVMTSPQPVKEWSNKQVIEWMAAVNMSNYIESFKRQEVDGKILASLDEDTLKKYGIEDDFHRQAMMICISELCGLEQSVVEPDENEECTSDESEHELTEHTFTSLQRCHKCNKFLYGVIRQGLQCQVCGLCIHRRCRQGKVPCCGRDRLSQRRRPSFTTEPLFGIDLESQCLASKASKERIVPDVLLVCTEEIELRIKSSKWEWDSFYRTPVSTESVCELKNALGESVTVDLSKFKSQVIGGIVKKYLRELSNPLIPVEYYEKFIDAARMEDPDKRTKAIVSLVNELPEHHNSTLKYMMSHFYKVVQGGGGGGGGGSMDDSRKKLAQVFCHILLRPCWDEIIKLVHNTFYHLRIFEHLFMHAAREYIPDSKKSTPTRHVPSPPNPEPMHENLDQCKWFWGDISKEEVHEQLNGTADGTFLVRRATTHVTNGDYTLTLRKGGKNRLIKIYHKSGRYGFSKPYEFSSVQELVQYFTVHSLAEYNKELNCTLEYPVVNQMQADNPVDDSIVFNELQLIHQEYQDQTTQYEKLLEKQSKTTQDIQMLYQAFDSFKELVKVFEEQLVMHRENSRNVPAHEYSKLQQNNTVLESRLRDITNSRNRLEASIKKKSFDNRQLIAQINSKKPEIKSLFKKCEQLRSILLNKGHDKKHIDDFLESSQRRDDDAQSDYGSMNGLYMQNLSLNSNHSITVEPTKIIPHKDQSTWFRDGVDRIKAKDVLRGRTEGTFLIRARGPDDFALSIIDENGQDVHCLISKGPDGYGFADPFKIHEMLIDLVLHYRETSLAEHNPTLNCKLLYPAYLSYES